MNSNCGQPFPELSEYEQIREQNIKEIQEAMKFTLGEITCMKSDLRSASDKPITKKKSKKTKRISSQTIVRKSERVKKNVCYKELNEPRCNFLSVKSISNPKTTSDKKGKKKKHNKFEPSSANSTWLSLQFWHQRFVKLNY